MPPATRRIILDMPADLALLRIVGASVQALLAEDADDLLRHDVEMALQEICVNIVVHAYKGCEDARLHLTLSSGDGELVAELSDGGQPFDPSSAPQPNLAEGQVHGYGMFMVHQLLDEVTYNRRDDRNHWRLTKRWK